MTIKMAVRYTKYIVEKSNSQIVPILQMKICPLTWARINQTKELNKQILINKSPRVGLNGEGLIEPSKKDN